MTIDANDLERMARERPDECFLKGSGVLKLTSGIRQLESELRAATATADWLLPDDMQALQRFCETCEDDQPYDVPKERMRRLAELGVIQWCGGARYSITAFGQHVLDLLPEGWPRLPLKTHADHDADSRAAFNAAQGVQPSDGGQEK